MFDVHVAKVKCRNQYLGKAVAWQCEGLLLASKHIARIRPAL